MQKNSNETPTRSFEEVYLNHEIFIRPNPDSYRGGYEWCVCCDGLELEVGLEFSVDEALIQARSAVNAIDQIRHDAKAS